MEVLANTIVVIKLQYTRVSNQHVNLQNVICQLYLNKARKKIGYNKKEKRERSLHAQEMQ